ncbi:MAG: Arm DNA-binding domain-containing protein [Bryobacterales bacterium]|nr:Arm DNA-binding domain-containing protein [Bryobacterales bacterium]
MILSQAEVSCILSMKSITKGITPQGERTPKQPSATFVKTVTRPGRYGDGRGSHGLSLLVKPMKLGGHSRTWSQRLRINGKPISIGLGSFPVVTLAEARKAA